MKTVKLTKPAQSGHKRPMNRVTRQGAARLLVMAGAIPLAGCIKLEAPTEPIVIELNINLTAESILYLADDAGSTLDDNADIF